MRLSSYLTHLNILSSYLMSSSYFGLSSYLRISSNWNSSSYLRSSSYLSSFSYSRLSGYHKRPLVIFKRGQNQTRTASWNYSGSGGVGCRKTHGYNAISVQLPTGTELGNIILQFYLHWMLGAIWNFKLNLTHFFHN